MHKLLKRFINEVKMKNIFFQYFSFFYFCSRPFLHFNLSFISFSFCFTFFYRLLSLKIVSCIFGSFSFSNVLLSSHQHFLSFYDIFLLVYFLIVRFLYFPSSLQTFAFIFFLTTFLSSSFFHSPLSCFSILTFFYRLLFIRFLLFFLFILFNVISFPFST